MLHSIKWIGLVAALGSANFPAWAVESHPFSVIDLWAIQRVSEHAVSPDGTQVVFVLRTTNWEENTTSADLWLVGSDGTRLRQLTTHPSSDVSPAWSADGKQIYFLSSRSGSSQVWRLPVDGGEAEPVTDYPLDVGTFKLSPDSTLLALTMPVFPECTNLECTTALLEERQKSKSSGRLFNQLFIRHWDAWKDGRRSHLFVRAVDGKDVTDLTRGIDADVPSKPFGGAEEITFTPDGRALVFVMRDKGRSEAWSTDFDLYAVAVDGTSPPRCLTDSNEAWDKQPVFSPDGRTLAYLAMSRPGYEADRFRVVLMGWPEGDKKVLTEEWDRSPASLTWSTDGSRLLVTADNLGQTSLFSIDVKSGQPRLLVEKGTVTSPQPAGQRLVFGLDHLRSPVELFSCDASGGDLRALTGINKDLLESVSLGDYEQFTFAGWQGETVHGFLVKPANFDPNKKYPVAFLIHGGPQGSFGNHFHYRWNPQTYAGAGYAAVMIDFHGSTGYGQSFTDSIRGDWGGKPLTDLRLGLEAALRANPWMDQERVGALGASYGGYMINWIAGNWTERFKCLVNHDGTLDMRSSYFSTEELWFPEWEQGGPYWSNPSSHEMHNPVLFVSRWNTPMLVIHGALDFRVPLEQGIATFTALQRLGIPSKFLYFPDENHWVLSPHNAVLWHRTVIEWLDQWLKN